MKRKASLSLSDMVLLATYRAAEGTTRRVPFETIVLQAWKDFPKHFSLKDHAEYPDSSVVYQRLYADLIARRLFVSLRKQVLRLTDKGLELAQQIEKGMSVQDVDLKAISDHPNREEQEFIDHALRSRAYHTWEEGKAYNLIDYDARVFLQFSTGTPLRERKRRLENAKEAIEKAAISGNPAGKSLRSLLEFIINQFPRLFEEA